MSKKKLPQRPRGEPIELKFTQTDILVAAWQMSASRDPRTEKLLSQMLERWSARGRSIEDAPQVLAEFDRPGGLDLFENAGQCLELAATFVVGGMREQETWSQRDNLRDDPMALARELATLAGAPYEELRAGVMSMAARLSLVSPASLDGGRRRDIVRDAQIYAAEMLHIHFDIVFRDAARVIVGDHAPEYVSQMEKRRRRPARRK